MGYFLDMGLGKTYVGSEKMKQLEAPYNLLICQKSKISDWEEHFKTYYKLITIVYDKQEINSIQENSVIIINYDLSWRRPELTKLKNYTLMLDESQNIKNETAKRSKWVLKLCPKNVILLSGTPTGGKYEELWSQCKLLGWNITKKLFWEHYIDYILVDVGGFKIKKVVGYKNVDRLKAKLREYGAIFQKTEEVFDLPEQIDNIVHIENTKEYKKFKRDRIITIGNQELIGDTSLTKSLYLRQLAGQYNKNKLEAVSELLDSTNDRVVIFYNFNAELELLKEICKDRPISYINGQGSDLGNYNTKTDTVTLVQYQAGASGVNLQLANKIIYFTHTLSSDMYQQSRKRIHRIGQSKSCMYYHLLTKGSIEEDIYKTLLERKDFTDQLFRRMEKC